MLVAFGARLAPPVKWLLLEAGPIVATRGEQRLESLVATMHEAWGGVLCLDFANTLEPRGGRPPSAALIGIAVRDELPDYDHLVAWALHKQVLAAPEAEELLIQADEQSRQAAAVVLRAHVLRDVIYRIYWDVAHDDPPAASDLTLLETEHRDAVVHARLLPSGPGFRWGWTEADADLARPLWPVAWSAAELLTTGDLERVKACAGPGVVAPCGWLFFDQTKNRGRRWCSMSDCGAGVKARRQTRRRREARGHDHARS